MEKQMGLIVDGQGTYKPMEQIRLEMSMNQAPIINHTPIEGHQRSFEDWTTIFERRAKERTEEFGLPTHVEIEIPATEKIAIALIGDTHAEAEGTDHRRIYSDIKKIKDSPYVYAMTLGDLTDSFCWFPAASEEIGNFDEANAWLKSGLQELKGKLLVGWIGDHDSWAGKAGTTGYHDFRKDYNAHLMHGVGYITLKVGEVTYKLMGTHRAEGNSMRDNTWTAKRMYAESGEGADIVFNAHIHKKGYSMQTVKSFGGDAHLVHYFSVGPYKATDEYARKHGWPPLTQEQMGGMMMILDPHEKHVEPVWRIS